MLVTDYFIYDIMPTEVSINYENFKTQITLYLLWICGGLKFQKRMKKGRHENVKGKTDIICPWWHELSTFSHEAFFSTKKVEKKGGHYQFLLGFFSGSKLKVWKGAESKVRYRKLNANGRSIKKGINESQPEKKLSIKRDILFPFYPKIS